MSSVLKVLELFSGTGSISHWAASQNATQSAVRYEVTSLDIRGVGRFNPTHMTDILQFDYRAAWQPGAFDWVHASPPCTMYSRARTTGGPRDLEGADRLVQRGLDIIDYLQPRLWTLENPQGLLMHRPLMQPLQPNMRVVDYCQYGSPWRKRTCIWTNAGGFEPLRCNPRTCASCKDGMHIVRLSNSWPKDEALAAQYRQHKASSRWSKGALPPALLDALASGAAGA
ncbi:hypothetical protein MNEG_5278 [Monoraphidium neglectum]|uniref:DNA (cytosine-5-)-methyltransferase n=1 Tax=Monoraphidium neglectum TaxID=145388 RepID=A0A0D2NB27_9CHLO|nr:hypothetical protein MNEG_5278 [Monoraphidium neglectum]KIZ02691.1 hypothetical protein MNEG_5278 [Monoraphidium neglectum]|eukprot:XP_013901710.1 hypothetical protein MNEG_5278 [Monoraphidium neglectum]